MTTASWTIRDLRHALAAGNVRPSELAQEALASANRNPGRNTYLWQDPAWTLAEAMRAEAMPRGQGGPFGDGRAALWGLPIAVKDCFDLAGAPTTCGVQFYRDLNGPTRQDSWLVEQLRDLGAVIVGKTHLHPLAWGITGENPEFGDCFQFRKPGALTGGSSSGSAASIMEGSAVAAIGTDTGGSVRAPAAYCGIAGYRATLGRGDWRGGMHLAETFDTMGWLFRDLEDAPFVAAPFAPADAQPGPGFTRFAFVPDSFLDDCEPEIVASFHAAIGELEELGLQSQEIDPSWWKDAIDIFKPIQAPEAARLHAGHFDRFETVLRERLEWGAQLAPQEVAASRRRHADFRARMDELFAAHELLLMPSTPVQVLDAAQGPFGPEMRARILRYTVAISLAGVPVVAIPCQAGGMTLAAARNRDEGLLELAGRLGAHRNAAVSAQLA
jgi:Asp-tRNA(Asn)/Glu-tRNA(Gln) amidotransferase A subunit family amidase